MKPWNSQRYRLDAPDGTPPEVTTNAIFVANHVVQKHPKLPVLLTLGHLAHYTGVQYRFLRQVVSRAGQTYRVFRIHKRPRPDGTREWRVICAPRPELKHVQRWIVENILRELTPHEASCAYSPDSSIVDTAKLHCQARWLIKMDIRRFFESIKESEVYHVFHGLGYQPLVSFELARLCTRIYDDDTRGRSGWFLQKEKYAVIPPYLHTTQGHLPQGAPTSPMLANLVVRELDRQLMDLAAESGLVYTRYADDLTFSTRDTFDRTRARSFIYKATERLATSGFRSNLAKTRIVPPKGRKIVLGLLCDREEPRLTKEFRANVRRHLFFLRHKDVGPVRHAHHRGFDAVAGLRNHLWGLLSFASVVDESWAEKRKGEFATIDWPL